jgi:hypothetical protein
MLLRGDRVHYCLAEPFAYLLLGLPLSNVDLPAAK